MTKALGGPPRTAPFDPARLLPDPATRAPLALYMLFHLNLAFSSLEEGQRRRVIYDCYWPLLALARANFPIAIEASGYTLEAIARLDPTWMMELKALIHTGQVEFVGSGYVQAIGPLLPAEVNAANLRIGHSVYQALLGIRPRIALVNEQAYAGGLVPLYAEAGYRALIMEWENCARHHPEWDRRWRHAPQYAAGPENTRLALLWNSSTAFQKLQRFAHGEIEDDECLDWLGGQIGPEPRSLALYGSDAEIFDHRPGRFAAEAALHPQGEWHRLGRLLAALRDDPRFDFVLPTQILDRLDAPEAGHLLTLESPEWPVPVKKQHKYNLTRWAVTGRGDLAINTACHDLHRRLAAWDGAGEADWKELCYLWSSDFRTHITPRRWTRYRARLAALTERLPPAPTIASAAAPVSLPASTVRITERGRLLRIETERVTLELNRRRGLAIHGLWFDGNEGPPLVGTLPHDFFDDIGFAADWYSGILVAETPGQAKVTDLAPVTPEITIEAGGAITVTGRIITPLGPIMKQIIIPAAEATISVSLTLGWEQWRVGSLRLGHVTLHPHAFDRDSLFYRTHNGGRSMEHFPLAGRSVDHGAPASFLVSASCGIGMSEGVVEFGDARRTLRLSIDKAAAALIGLVTHRPIGDSVFCRFALSALEMDETRKPEEGWDGPCRYAFTLGLV
jgi:hypothetical protein